jgi:hypothetical protein
MYIRVTNDGKSLHEGIVTAKGSGPTAACFAAQNCKGPAVFLDPRLPRHSTTTLVPMWTR